MVQSNIHTATEHVFAQLAALIQGCSIDIYSASTPVLMGSSIGQHVRHILEFYRELEQGYPTGLVDYARRKRDLILESNPEVALAELQQLPEKLRLPAKMLRLAADYSAFQSEIVEVETTFDRELVFNLEHAVHHMALIRIGYETQTGQRLAPEFGVAASTLTHRNSEICAR